MNTFSQRVVNDWNALPDAVVTCPGEDAEIDPGVSLREDTGGSGGGGTALG